MEAQVLQKQILSKKMISGNSQQLNEIQTGVLIQSNQSNGNQSINQSRSRIKPLENAVESKIVTNNSTTKSTTRDKIESTRHLKSVKPNENSLISNHETTQSSKGKSFKRMKTAQSCGSKELIKRSDLQKNH